MKRLMRKWINQPSTLQPYHALDGKRVIYDPNTEEIWFTEGDIISQQIQPIALSSGDGWPPLPDTPTVKVERTPIPQTLLDRLARAEKAIEEAGKIRCVCSGFYLQYEGSCSCVRSHALAASNREWVEVVRELAKFGNPDGGGT
jgi:hypothetical protein